MILHGIEYQRPTSLNMRILADHVTYSFLAFMKSIFHFCLGCYCGGYSQNGRSNLSSFVLLFPTITNSSDQFSNSGMNILIHRFMSFSSAGEKKFVWWVTNAATWMIEIGNFIILIISLQWCPSSMSVFLLIFLLKDVLASSPYW